MIHILGAGNIGSLFAVSLAQKHPVKLILRSPAFKEFTGINNSLVRVNSNGKSVIEKELNAVQLSELKEPIKRLVVAVKSYSVESALNSVRSSLSPNMDVLIVHNGMGVEERARRVLQSFNANVSYGITTVGCKRALPLWSFECNLNGWTTVMGENSLTSDLKECTSIFPTNVLPRDLFVIEQKRKLVMNAVVNSLTAILGCPNGALLALDQADLIYRITRESCRVLELDATDMYNVILDVLDRTSKNLSSMLVDVENRRQTEIEYINGYIVQQAQKKGMKAPLNSMLQNLVNMKAKQIRHDAEMALPHKNEP